MISEQKNTEDQRVRYINKKQSKLENSPQPVSQERRIVLISKALSKLLRHQAIKENLSIDSKGFVPVSEILGHKLLKSLKCTISELFMVVNDNDKKRFKIVIREKSVPGLNCKCGEEKEITVYDDSISVSRYYICALQGHSIKAVDDSYGMKLIDADSLPSVIVHGTYKRFLRGIKESGGLSKMKRNHIHFAEGLPGWLKERRMEKSMNLGELKQDGDENETVVISGMRKSCEVLIYLDVELIKRSGLRFYRSDNGVILTEGDKDGVVGVEYFSKVTDLLGNNIVF